MTSWRIKASWSPQACHRSRHSRAARKSCSLRLTKFKTLLPPTSIARLRTLMLLRLRSGYFKSDTLEISSFFCSDLSTGDFGMQPGSLL